MDASLDQLAMMVRRAVDGFTDKYGAWAQILHWPVEAVKKNPGHARDLVTMTMARNAVAYHPASAVKSGLGGTIGGAQQTADNAIAKATYDPRRAPLEGVGTSALMAGMTAAPFGFRDGSNGHADLPEPVPGLMTNRAIGKRWEIDGAEIHLAPYQHSLQPQATILSLGPSGRRVCIDYLGIDSMTGRLMLSEFKSSSTAKFTENQKIVFPELKKHGGRLIGKAKFARDGDNILPPTKVDVYRKLKP